MLLALTRDVSPAISRCELTHLAREPIDLGAARAQHDDYVRCLGELGCTIERLVAEPELPDSVFIEDTAVVLDEVAVMTRPGAESRRPETAAVASALARYRSLREIESPGTLDGGDVLHAGRVVIVGRSSRTNDAGIAQLRDIVESLGYTLRVAEVGGCLHLKSAVTPVANDVLLVNRDWISMSALGGFDTIDVAPGEAFAANALRVGGSLIYPAAFPRTRERLERRGLDVRTVDASELAKAEGGVTCCGLIFETRTIEA